MQGDSKARIKSKPECWQLCLLMMVTTSTSVYAHFMLEIDDEEGGPFHFAVCS